MEQTATKQATSRNRNTQFAKKSRNMRAIAQLPFRGTISVKVIDAAIKAVMAKRKADAQRAVQIAVPGQTTVTASASK